MSEKFRIIPPEEDGPKKRFEIIQPDSEAPKKRFEIQPRKKFDIISEGSSDELSEKPWFKQENMNDCGPCMILNVLNQLGVHTADSIEEVRNQVNQLRRASSRRALGTNDWLTSEDIGEYLSKIAGLSVEEYACFKDVQQEVDNAIQRDIQEEPYDAIYMTNGSHYRAVVNVGEQEMLMDSFAGGPQEIDSTSRNEEIRKNIFSSGSERVEKVGVVRMNRGAGYRVIAL